MFKIFPFWVHLNSFASWGRQKTCWVWLLLLWFLRGASWKWGIYHSPSESYLSFFLWARKRTVGKPLKRVGHGEEGASCCFFCRQFKQGFNPVYFCPSKPSGFLEPRPSSEISSYYNSSARPALSGKQLKERFLRILIKNILIILSHRPSSYWKRIWKSVVCARVPSNPHERLQGFLFVGNSRWPRSSGYQPLPSPGHTLRWGEEAARPRPGPAPARCVRGPLPAYLSLQRPGARHV